MFELQFTRQFKKDFKRYKSDPVKVREVFSLLKLLERGDSIPKEFKPHRLKGNYKDYLECHIESDLLLIWLRTLSFLCLKHQRKFTLMMTMMILMIFREYLL